MIRSVLAVLAAPLVWGVLQGIGGVATNAVFPAAATAAQLPLAYLVVSLVLSIGYSLASGATTALIARRNARQHGLWAGIALLAVGVAVQMSYWSLMPLWYHVMFLALLVPAAVLGAMWVGDGSE